MHPVWFTVFGYPLHFYAVAIATGYLVGLWAAVRYGQRQGLDRDMLLDLCWWLLVSGLVGSRIVFIIVEWRQYWYPCFDIDHYNTLFPDRMITERDCTRLLRFWNGGLVFYGGIIGAILTMIWFLRREKVPLWPVADALIPSVALGQFFGRLGCLAAGCCHGKLTDVPWGIEFPRTTVLFREQLQEGLVAATDTHALAVHPTQLYDSLGGLLLFLALVAIRHRKRYHGQVFLAWLFLYPLMRTTIELFRGDTDRGFLVEVISEPLNQALGLRPGSVTFLTTSQFISAVIVVIAGVALWRLRRGAGTSDAPAQPPEPPPGPPPDAPPGPPDAPEAGAPPVSA